MSLISVFSSYYFNVFNFPLVHWLLQLTNLPFEIFSQWNHTPTVINLLCSTWRRGRGELCDVPEYEVLNLSWLESVTEREKHYAVIWDLFDLSMCSLRICQCILPTLHKISPRKNGIIYTHAIVKYFNNGGLTNWLSIACVSMSLTLQCVSSWLSFIFDETLPLSTLRTSLNLL